jgi:hypothetical protein
VSYRYEFRFRGKVDQSLRDELHQLDLEVTEPAETVFVGTVEDKTALHGLLRRFEHLGLDIVEVHRGAQIGQGSNSS